MTTYIAEASISYCGDYTIRYLIKDFSSTEEINSFQDRVKAAWDIYNQKLTEFRNNIPRVGDISQQTYKSLLEAVQKVRYVRIEGIIIDFEQLTHTYKKVTSYHPYEFIPLTDWVEEQRNHMNDYFQGCVD